MPELPEVETVRRAIASHVVGKRVSKVEVGRERSVRRVGREAVIHGLTGNVITGVRRRGKYLLCDLESGDVMMIHLRMSGRVMVQRSDQDRLAHTHVVLSFDDDSEAATELRFVDPRTFGEVVVYDPEDEEAVVPELFYLGVDPIEDEFNAEVLSRILSGRRGAIKPLLLNQRMIAGIGNIYADEILHLSRLRWNRVAHSLSRQRIATMADAITHVLSTAIDAGGSTLDDTQYVDVDGEFGRYQDEHRVYGRAGQLCVTCGKASIVRIAVAGRGTWFCPRCQR